MFIGDSNVAVIANSDGYGELYNLGLRLGVHQMGLSSAGLYRSLFKVKRDFNIDKVFIAIGTNDCYIREYKINGQLISNDYSSAIKNRLKYLYPNAKNLYIIWGTIGWGGTRYCKPKNQLFYYHMYVKNGFIPINPTPYDYDYHSKDIHVIQYAPDDMAAHTKNSPYVKYIIKEMSTMVY